MNESERSSTSSSEVKTEGTVSQRKLSEDADQLVSKARHYADLGDRWFVSVGRAIARSANRVSGEATFVADSAGKAADTTLHIGRELVGVMSNKVVTIRLPRPKFVEKRAKKKAEGGSVEALLHNIGTVAMAHAKTIEALPADQLDSLVHQVCNHLEHELTELSDVSVEPSSGEIVDSYPTQEDGSGKVVDAYLTEEDSGAESTALGNALAKAASEEGLPGLAEPEEEASVGGEPGDGAEEASALPQKTTRKSRSRKSRAEESAPSEDTSTDEPEESERIDEDEG